MHKISRKHHYVPKMLLRNFTTSSGTLWACRRDDGKLFETSPDNLFTQRDLNTTIRQDGSKDDSLEKWYSKMESAGAPFFQSLADRIRAGKGLVLSDEAWDFWHHFLYHHIKRPPAIIDRIAAELGTIDTLDKAIEDAVADDPDALRGEERTTVLQRMLQAAKVNARSREPSPEVREVFTRLGMTVFRIPGERKSFVVGDQAFAAAKIGGQCLFFAPIAYDLALGYFDEPKTVSILSIDDTTARRMNEAITARSSVIAGRSNKLVASLVAAWS